MSVAVANIGTLFRLRLLFLLPLCVVASGGIAWIWGRLEDAKPILTEKPVRILRILTRLNIGGPSVHAALLATRLDPERFETDLVVGRPEPSEGDLTQDLVRKGARVIQIDSLRRPLHPWRDAVTFVRLLRFMGARRPRILHTHMAKAGALGRAAGLVYNHVGPGRRAACRLKRIHTFHGHVLQGYFSPRTSRLFAAIERWLAKHTDLLIAVSPAIRDELLSLKIGTPEKIRVIPLGLDLGPLAELPSADGKNPVCFGMVGRLVDIKNPGMFLDGFSRMDPVSRARVRGVVVGDGPLRPSLEADIRRRGLEKVVELTGWKMDLLNQYRSMDALCLTSWNEGTPVAVIEAMAAGRPVVATDVGGVRDLLSDGDGLEIPEGGVHQASRGLMVRSGDGAGLAKAIEMLTLDSGLRRRLGEAGRSHVLSRYTAERLVADLTKLYSDLTESGV